MPPLSNGLWAGQLPCIHSLVEWLVRNSTNRPKNFPAGFAMPKQATGFELAKLLRRKTLLTLIHMLASVVGKSP